MGLVAILFRFLRHNLILFVCIVLVLASASWMRSEWTHVRSLVDALPALHDAHRRVQSYHAELARQAQHRVGQLATAGLQQLDARLRVIDASLATLQQQDEASILPAVLKGSAAAGNALAQAAMRQAGIELLRQERQYLVAMRAHVHARTHRETAASRLAQLHREHVQAWVAVQGAVQRRAAFKAAAGRWARLPLGDGYRQMQELDRQVALLTARNNAAHRAYLAQRALAARVAALPALAAFQVDLQRLAATAAPLRERILETQQRAAHSAGWQLYLAVRPLLPVALGVLAAWWLVPAALRAVFYFVLAPLAARRPAIVIGKPAGSVDRAAASRHTLTCAVTHRLVLAPGQELLIRPDYCQSQPAGALVGTAFLFDWRHPFTSIAARLWMLTRLRPVQACDVVVSSTADPLDELALLELAPGEAFVLQPRALAGVICPAGTPPNIRSHWRLASLHAWLTLQLRYLAFEGPATLIVKGCRGVRLESAQAGRTISQDATLGFSAGCSYTTVRAEPFMPYLAGTQALFHDRFAGSGACYLYEEVPRRAQPGRRRDNPLDMLFDAGLKAFGI